MNEQNNRFPPLNRNKGKQRPGGTKTSGFSSGSDAHAVRAGLNIRGSHPLTTLGLIDRLLGLTNVRP